MCAETPSIDGVIRAAVIRAAGPTDLAAINTVIAEAIATWRLPERVKRLALPVYRYTEADLGHLSLRVLDPSGEPAGLAAWEPAGPRDGPDGESALLLHGLYVRPALHRRGIGLRLLEDGEALARATGCSGLVVRAQADAEAFFAGHGFSRLPVRDTARDYAARWWRPLS